MFPQQPQQQFRKAGADVRIFYGANKSTAAQLAWNKPRGVSHVYMMLIGAGGDGDGVSAGGGSGAVTVWYGAAQNVPDALTLSILDTATTVRARFSTVAASNAALLTANSGGANNGAGGAAMTPNQFSASGFFKSTTGQDGGTTVFPSATTFLSGGGTGGGTLANYGYRSDSTAGYFMLQPIIVGCAGSGLSTSGGVGCGASYQTFNTFLGGPGMILIASW